MQSTPCACGTDVCTVKPPMGLAVSTRCDRRGSRLKDGESSCWVREERRCAVILALARNGAREVMVVNRSRSRAETAALLAGARGRVATQESADGADIVINATPIGMGADARLPVDAALLGRGQVVNDLIYHPATTPLLAAAARRGAACVGGAGMLLHQAARQCELWTGEKAPLEAMQRRTQCRPRAPLAKPFVWVWLVCASATRPPDRTGITSGWSSRRIAGSRDCTIRCIIDAAVGATLCCVR